MFWVAYEQSAYYIWQIKGYKPAKKWVKSIAIEVVQMGFPKRGFVNGYVEAIRHTSILYKIYPFKNTLL